MAPQALAHKLTGFDLRPWRLMEAFAECLDKVLDQGQWLTRAETFDYQPAHPAVQPPIRPSPLN